MMSRAKGVSQIAHGASWMMGVQLLIGLGQFAYGSVTARLLPPAVFGGFAAALGLEGLIVLLTTTGLPSFVLRAESLPQSLLRSIRITAVVGGALATLLYVGLSFPWLLLLGAHTGWQFVPVLTVAQAVGPIASVESALLRRERRVFSDGITLVLAFGISTAVGVVALLCSHAPWTLGVATSLYPIILCISAITFRKNSDFPSGEAVPFREIYAYIRSISFQNVAFLLLGQLPSWIASRFVGVAALGMYSRANTLAFTPANMLATALTRTLQPHWRTFSTLETFGRGIRDAASISAALAFAPLSVLAALSPFVIEVWLGSGWSGAAPLAGWLSIAFALQVPFTVIASASEMRGLLASVRKSQLVMAFSLAPALIVLIWTRDPTWAAIAVVASQLGGLLALCVELGRRTSSSSVMLLRVLVCQALWAVPVGLSSFASSQMAFEMFDVDGRLWRATVAVAVGVIVGGIVWILTLRWNGVWGVLVDRGIRVPQFMRR